MKICIIRPPRFMIEGAPTPSITPPLGESLIAAVLAKDGHTVTAIDAIAEAPLQFQKEEIPVKSERVRVGYNLISMGLSFAQIIQRMPVDINVIRVSFLFSTNWLFNRTLMNLIGEKSPHATLALGDARKQIEVLTPESS